MIPPKVLERIQQNEALVIRWAGHRDIIEIVEEWGDSLFWLSNLWLAVYFFGVPVEGFVIIGLVLLSIACLIPAILETHRYKNEWHILTRDQIKGGGMYFNASGILNLQMTPLDITKVIPLSNEYKNNLFYWFWKKTTAHRFERVTLKSDAGIFLLSDNRMPIEFVNAWMELRGPVTVTKPEDGIWYDVDHLHRVMVHNLFDYEEGKHIIRQLIHGKYYG